MVMDVMIKFNSTFESLTRSYLARRQADLTAREEVLNIKPLTLYNIKGSFKTVGGGMQTRVEGPGRRFQNGRRPAGVLTLSTDSCPGADS